MVLVFVIYVIKAFLLARVSGLVRMVLGLFCMPLTMMFATSASISTWVVVSKKIQSALVCLKRNEFWKAFRRPKDLKRLQLDIQSLKLSLMMSRDEKSHAHYATLSSLPDQRKNARTTC